MTDEQWWSVAEGRFDDHWRDYAGSPETFANAARSCYSMQDFGTAACFYRKAVDLLHTLYGFDNMARRQPSAADAQIVDGYVSSIGASRALHPGASVALSVREVTHRLRSISTTCRRVGLPPNLYVAALERLGSETSDIAVDDILWT